MKDRTGRKRGFTLVEIMIVVAIIGILAAMMVPNFKRARAKSQAIQPHNSAESLVVPVFGSDLSSITNWIVSNEKDLKSSNQVTNQVDGRVVIDIANDNHEAVIKLVSYAGANMLCDPVYRQSYRKATLRELDCLYASKGEKLRDKDVVALGSYTMEIPNDERSARLYPAICKGNRCFVKQQEVWPTNFLFAVVKMNQ